MSHPNAPRRYFAPAGGDPIIGLNECGDDMELILVQIGTIRYSRTLGSESLARQLERAAELVRRKAREAVEAEEFVRKQTSRTDG